MVARIQNERLFGDASPAPTMSATSTAVADGDVTVIGIVYSPESSDSVALLSVGGNAVVSHVGTQLPTGQVVTGIEPDKVQLRSSSGLISLLLDIKQADPDQRITPGEYAVASGPDGPPGDSLGAATVPSSTGPSAPPPVRAVSLVPTHFVSLKSLRGAAAEKRFQSLDAPIVRPGPHP